MPAKRIIPCLDVTGGRVVKGTNFVDLRDAGDPVELAARYSAEGADEIVFLDIGATPESRQSLVDVIAATAREVFVPLTVGGGVRSVPDARRLFEAGADKVAVNTSAVQNPELISALAEALGRQAVVLAIDARRVDDSWQVVTHGGRLGTDLDAVHWAAEGVRRGAGEILLTSMDADGVRSGFDIPLTAAVCDRVNAPVIASGGASGPASFVELFQQTDCEAGLAASIFHLEGMRVGEVRAALRAAGIEVRPA
ncbi:MAG: imidazole glycerol phosphate synthase subunit HisF [Chthonomonas sp.]|nr:imidazole glycerol phosphate synthase subunit HisF [Chthonomonas sp.]